MVQGTTPTFILTLPNTVDLTAVSNLYFSLEQGSTKLQKTGSSLSIDGQNISVYLTQAETLKFNTGRANLQLNWTYPDGSCLASPSFLEMTKAFEEPGRPMISLYVGARVSVSNSQEAFITPSVVSA